MGNTIRILWLYKYFPQYNYDRWFHMDFAQSIKDTEGVELLAYGHDLNKGYPELAPILYDPKITMQDIKRKFDFNVVILNTKSRMFLNYLPPRKNKGKEIRETCWLPPDTAAWNRTLKIVIEEDFHYEEDDSWYQSIGINHILQRHYYQSLRTIRTPATWFPFSVDTNVFKPNPDIKRINKIGFVGCDALEVYPHRSKVVNILRSLGYLIKEGSLANKKIGGEYIRVLQLYVSHLNTCSAYFISSAKMFEIMASGSVLLTNLFCKGNDNYGLQKLFPDNSYCTFMDDYSDLVQKTRKIIENEEYRNELVTNGLKCINSKHTNPIRIQQLLSFLKDKIK